MNRTLLVCCLCGLAAALTVSGATLLQEDFSGATPGPNNNLSGTQFQVTSGNVDIVGVLNGSFFACVNNAAGNCIDMVGSPGLGAISSIPTFNLISGNSYTISFGYILQGFATGTTPTSDFTVGLGSFSDMLTAIPEVQDASLIFTAGSSETGVHLTIASDTTPDDLHGAVIDHIRLMETPGTVSGVPEPSTVALIGVGLVAAVGLVRKRRTF